MPRHLALALVLVLAACGADDADRGTATVTLDVFSGRPNPTFALDPDAADTLLHHWESMEVTDPVEYPGYLGYRALIVDFADGSSIWFSGGFAVAEPSGQTRIDEDRAVESWLLERAALSPDPIDQELLAQIRSEISG